MAKAFRATVQSEVVDGSRGEEHVQREVLESFAGKNINDIACS